jgi:isocitrate dehydrogenase (NAD+)
VRHPVTLIPGDGIGPVVVGAARRVLDATGVGLDWDVHEAGGETFESEGAAVPEALLASIRANRVALKGPVATPLGAEFRSVNLTLRRELDLYATVRPCRRYAGVRSVYDDVDIVVIRESTEGMYTGMEFEEGVTQTRELIEFIDRETGRRIRDDAGITIKAISVGGSERIARFAFDYARRHGRDRVTAAHKANIMKFSDGLFLRTVQRVAKEYPDVAFDDRIIDALCMQIVSAPERFDVLVMPNLYGDVVSDLGAGLIGGLGVAPGASFGDEVAVFEATHGTGPRIRDPGMANPIAVILSGVLMLRHLGESEAARSVSAAVAQVLAKGTSVTYDLKPFRDDPSAVSADAVADAVIDLL